MSVKNYLLIGGALLASACSTSSMIGETGDIAERFCLSNVHPHSEERKLLLSPSLTHAMKTAQMRHGIIVPGEPAVAAEEQTILPREADIMPPHAGDTLIVTQETASAIAEETTSAICKPGRVFTMNGIRYAEIHHAPAGGGEGWTDRLVLKEIGGRWMIDDILFAPDYRRTMRETLIRAE